MKELSYDQQIDEDSRNIDGIAQENEDGSVDVELPEDDDELGAEVENADGSVTFMEDEEKTRDSDFYENLADVLDKPFLNQLATTLTDRIEQDREARKKRDEQYEDGLRRSGLGNDAPGGAEFEGASKVVHPMLAEACIDFSAAAMKELFPPNGPVKSKIVGKQTRERKERADRKTEYLNWQFTTQIEEYRSELETLLSQLPMGGSQYQKFHYDDNLGRSVCEFVPVDEVYLPFHATSLYTAQRVTHHQRITRMQFEERVESGLYIDSRNTNSDAVQLEQRSATAAANAKIEGVELDAELYNEDGLRDIYEIYLWQKVEDDTYSDGKYAPYILTIDAATNEVLALYRNWEEDDEKLKKLDWWVDWGFLSWRGAYKLGLPHVIGGLSAAATGALRALLDSAHINNAASAIKLKGGRAPGQSDVINITQVSEIEAPAGVDDIRKLIMPMPFNPPSTVLFQLLGWLSDAAKGVVTTAEEKIADASNNMPVGTTLALIEQGSKVMSSIHARLHASQQKAIDIICRLNKVYLDDEEVRETFDEQIVTREDFENNSDVAPVSDPNIFSDAQRMARWQAVLQMTQDQSVPWKKLSIYREGLRMMKVDDIDAYLPPDPEDFTSDPVTENAAALMNPVNIKATVDQDHLAHLFEHLRFLIDPLQGANPVVDGTKCQTIMNHCADHLTFLYLTTAQEVGKRVAEQAGMSGQQMSGDKLAQISTQMMHQIEQQYGPQLMPLFQQAMQAIQPKLPKPPADPTQATLQAAMAETQRRAQRDQQEMQLKQVEIQQAAQAQQISAQQAMQQQQIELQKWQKEQSDQLLGISEELRQQAQKDRDDNLIEWEKIRQGWTKLEQDAAKLGMERQDAIQQMLQEMQQRVLQPQADMQSHVQQINELVSKQQQDQHGQQMAGLLQGIHGLLQNQQTHQQSMADAVKQLLSQGE